ncbi:MAG TPA: DoxX family protein [Rhodanobacteraceae bacterium]|nr:DoxX family protein [Rhodanobacteraceae bacterium]
MAGDDSGKLLLRLLIGALLLFHGIAKIVYGIDDIGGLLVANGLPGSIASAVYIGEIVAPLCLIFGVWVRVAGLVIAANMIFAIVLAHPDHVFQLGPTGGWKLELQAFYLLGGLVVAMLGAGKYAAQRRRSALN